ncbi:MAG: glycosyltransferase family 39 protein [Planctomycetota bacterium]
MSNSQDSRRDPSLFVFLFALLGLTPCIWSPGSVSGQDEYWLSLRTPLEMQAEDSWWTPIWEGEPRLKKPPMLYWLIRSGYELFGINLFAARLWGVLFGAGFAVMAVKIWRRMFDGSGLLPGLFTATAIGVMVESRRAMHDLPMAFFVLSTVWLALRFRERPTVLRALPMAATAAGATLTKGPVPMLFLVAAFLAAKWTKPLGPADKRPGPAALGATLVAFFALALPWPLSMQALHPQFAEVLAEQSSNRELGFTPKSISAVVFGGLGLAAPWCLLVLHALWRLRAEGTSKDRFLAAWILCAAVPFLFLKSFERYLIPLVVPMAMLAARQCERLSEKALRRHLGIATSVVSILVLVFVVFVLWFKLGLVWPLLLAALCAWTIRDAFKIGRPRRTALQIGVFLAVLFGPVYTQIGINPFVTDLPSDFQSRDIATFLRAQPAYLSMQRRQSITQLDPGEEKQLRAFDGYVFVQHPQLEAFDAFCKSAGVQPRVVMRFHQFYSRKVWLRFMRKGLKWPDWKEALLDRNPDRIRHRFVCFEVEPERGG